MMGVEFVHTPTVAGGVFCPMCGPQNDARVNLVLCSHTDPRNGNTTTWISDHYECAACSHSWPRADTEGE